jgi:hypothetical protein
MKNILLLFFAILTMSSCSVQHIYDILMNGSGEYQLSTDCGTITLKTEFAEGTIPSYIKFNISSSELEKYSINPEKLKLYVNSNQIVKFRSEMGNKKTELKLFYDIGRINRNSSEIFILADSVLVCNSQSLLPIDTVKFAIVPRN